jgi:hypothetical protein
VKKSEEWFKSEERKRLLRAMLTFMLLAPSAIPVHHFDGRNWRVVGFVALVAAAYAIDQRFDRWAGYERKRSIVASGAAFFLLALVQLYCALVLAAPDNAPLGYLGVLGALWAIDMYRGWLTRRE